MALPGQKEQLKASGIVWWDYFSETKSTKDSAPAFLCLWSTANDLPPDKVEQILKAIGYPEDIAYERAHGVTRSASEDESGNSLTTNRNSGAEAVLFSICEQAINDIKMLVQHRVIVDGQLVPNWPPKNSNGVVGYKGRGEVAALLDWVVNGSLQEMMNDLGMNLDINQVLCKIGLRSKMEHVA
jgi:hypothetical protein